MKKKTKIILWIVSSFMFLLTLGAFVSSAISGILMLFVAVGCNPIFLNLLSKVGKKPKKRVLIPTLTVLFFVAMSLSPTQETANNEIAVTTQVEQQTEIIETIEQSQEIETQETKLQEIETQEKKTQETELQEIETQEIESQETTSKQKETESEEFSIEEETKTIEETMVEVESTEPVENKVLSEMAVHFIDVGQGDATLIICDDEAMLIDAGDNNQGTKIQNYLQKQGVKSLKYVIATHPDADHIGGMDVVLYKFNCDTIVMTDEEKDSNTYRDVIDTMKGKGYKNTKPVVGNTYTLGDAEFTIVGPKRITDDSNNNSVAILLKHGENEFLFTGDAEETQEADIVKSGISLDVDVYKVGHHGSKTSSSTELLNLATPTYAVISCGEGNSYGHPHAETLNNLRSNKVKVFRTDEQGSIVATSNGTEIKWNCSPSETWQAGEATESSSNNEKKDTVVNNPQKEQVEEQPVVEIPVEQPTTITYICNTNTDKFHHPYCSSVDQMSEKNKLAVTCSRDELISQGYVPCKRCNP